MGKTKFLTELEKCSNKHCFDVQRVESCNQVIGSTVDSLAFSAPTAAPDWGSSRSDHVNQRFFKSDATLTYIPIGCVEAPTESD